MKDQDFQLESVLWLPVHEVVQLIVFKINYEVLKFDIILFAKIYIKIEKNQLWINKFFVFVHMIDWCNESIYWISFKIQTSPLPLHNKTYHLKLTHTFVILCKAWGLNITTKTSIVTSISMKHTTCNKVFEWQTSYGVMTRILEPWIWFQSR